ENNQLSLLQVRINGKSGLLDITQIGFAAVVERRRDADQHRVGFSQLGEIRGGAEVLADDKFLDLIWRNVLDVRPAGIEHGNLIRVGIETDDLVTRFGKAQGQRQADVAAADDPHLEVGAFEEFGFAVDGHRSEEHTSELQSLAYLV